MFCGAPMLQVNSNPLFMQWSAQKVIQLLKIDCVINFFCGIAECGQVFNCSHAIVDSNWLVMWLLVANHANMQLNNQRGGWQELWGSISALDGCTKWLAAYLQLPRTKQLSWPDQQVVCIIPTRVRIMSARSVGHNTDLQSVPADALITIELELPTAQPDSLIFPGKHHFWYPFSEKTTFMGCSLRSSRMAALTNKIVKFHDWKTFTESSMNVGRA